MVKKPDMNQSDSKRQKQDSTCTNQLFANKIPGFNLRTSSVADKRPLMYSSKTKWLAEQPILAKQVAKHQNAIHKERNKEMQKEMHLQ